ncbi:hypothetical protein EMPS_04443 [Entomortierella parvispora]|uniref:C2H2-type domain-containing protein n=1 Tax=Entomortierella parvispora TaxID=205924 RepID=A0A9P3LVE4_9FUNG|nr:hypothetical protein EMPS_04443 [Entomortierella parvispora]
MADSTVAEQTAMDSSLHLNSMSNHESSPSTAHATSSSPRNRVTSEDVEMSTAQPVGSNTNSPQHQHHHPQHTSHHPSPMSLKGNKNVNIMLGATPMAHPHPLSMNSENNSLHHFQTDPNSHPLYSTTTHIDPSLTNSPNGNSHGMGNSAFVQATLGPLSIPTSPSSFSSQSLVPSSTTAAFMAMHGHNSSLMEQLLPRRNSVPTLTADMAEHRRKISAEEKTLHRQASWSNLSSNSLMLNGAGNHSGFPSATLSGFQSLDTSSSPPSSSSSAASTTTLATHVDPNMMHYYRASSMAQTPHHGFHNQMLPSTTNSSACPSPMPESFMPGSALNTISSTSSSSLGLLASFQNSSLDGVFGEDTKSGIIKDEEDDDENNSPLEGHQGVKIKRNNSVCSTTSMSSTGSGDSHGLNSGHNKHPCKVPACGWSFKRYEHLKRHMLVHSKERPFVCGVQGCDKSFSRSDNFSAHLRTHSKKGSIHHDEDGPSSEEGGDSSVKHEAMDLQGSLSQTVGAETSEDYHRDYSPPSSPFGEPSSMQGDEPYTMMSQTGYPFSAASMYPLDPLENLSAMVPRFEPVRLDLKSIAPSDIHKQPYEDGTVSTAMLTSHGDGESPHPSPMEHYEHFGFPSSISTHFMPMLHAGFPLDQVNLHHHHHHHQQQQLQQQQQHHHVLHHQSSLESTTSSYSPLPSADSTSSSVSSFHQPGYHPEYHGFHFSSGMDTSSSPSSAADLHYAQQQQQQQQMTASPLSSVDPHHQHHHPLSQHHNPHLHHPHPHHAAHILQHNPHHPQQQQQQPHHPHHGGFPSMMHPSPNSALPPHPLMSTSPFSAPGLNEPMYSSSSASSSSTSLSGHRVVGASSPSPTSSTATITPTTGTSTPSSLSNNVSSNGHSGSSSGGHGGGGGGSKHGGSGKHHTCNVIGCSKRFKRLEHLKRHIKTHTLERPFNCPYTTCTKKFSRSDNLSQHVKTHQRQMTKLQMKQRNQAQAQAHQQQQQQQQVQQQVQQQLAAGLNSMNSNSGPHRLMVEM